MTRSMGAGVPQHRARLVASFDAEKVSFLRALSGGFVAPGPGNDPIRNPESLPTGRNFHALDGGQIPTRSAHALGVSLARDARARAHDEDGVESVVLWASDTVRDEGTMVSFGLEMLGLTPVWDPRGLLRGLTRRELAEGESRRDVSFVTSGLFRDLYPNLLTLLDRAVLLTLDASSETIREAMPVLAIALEGALAPLGEQRRPGHEPLATNAVARHWVQATEQAIARGVLPARAGRDATLRVFGNAQGGYGAGINRLAEQSASFRDRRELADVFLHRMGHAYGVDLDGEPVHDVFREVVTRTTHTYLGRASHLYGVLDNNDGYDYLGGLSVAVEHASGHAPESFVVRHADASRAYVEPLAVAIQAELRGRHLNPEVLRALMQHDYAGARTMSTGFVENLWGFQVTNPEVVSSATWEEVRKVFMEDAYGIGLDDFLERGPNAHVKANMLAILLVAAQRGYYTPGEATLTKLASDFARLVRANGLPGSGHTDPSHPVMDFVAARLTGEARQGFEQTIARARPSGGGHARAFEASVRAMAASPAGRVATALVGLAIAGLVVLGFSRGAKGRTK
jgi:cobaltochelatase CobN